MSFSNGYVSFFSPVFLCHLVWKSAQSPERITKVQSLQMLLLPQVLESLTRVSCHTKLSRKVTWFRFLLGFAHCVPSASLSSPLVWHRPDLYPNPQKRAGCHVRHICHVCHLYLLSGELVEKTTPTGKIEGVAFTGFLASPVK